MFATILFSVFLTSCSLSVRAPDTQKKEELSTKTTVTTTKKDEEEQRIKKSISEYIAGFYGDENVVRISLGNSKVEARVRLDILSKGDVPDDWEDIVKKAEAVGGGIIESIPDNEKYQNGVLYLVDPEDNNLLSVLNGKASYSAFTQYTYEGENAPTISLAEFNAIKTGMTYQEVFDIVGSRGEKISESDLGLGDEYYTAIFQWDGEGSLGANANVTFQGGKVVSKAQFGLE